MNKRWSKVHQQEVESREVNRPVFRTAVLQFVGTLQ